MRLQVWNTHDLALALAQGRLSYRDKFLYLVASDAIWVAAGYIGAFVVAQPSGWLFWYQGLMVLIVTVFGLIRCRDKYEGGPEDRFIEATVVLSVPLSIKFLAFTWLAYLVYGPTKLWLLSGVEFTADSPLKLFEFLLGVADNFYALLIATVGVLVYYLRLATHLQTVAVEASGI